MTDEKIEEKAHRQPTARSITKAISTITPEALGSSTAFTSEALMELRDVTIPGLVASINVECMARAKKLTKG